MTECYYDGNIMMSRTQISLDPDLHKKAKERAAELGISLAEYLRRLVADDLHHPKPAVDPSVVFGLGDSGGSDVARDKHRYVAEAIATEHERRANPGRR